MKFSALAFKLPKLCLNKKFEKQIWPVYDFKDHLVNLCIQRQVWNLKYQGKKSHCYFLVLQFLI